MNKIVIALIIAILLVGGFYWLNNYIYNEKQGDDTSNLFDTMLADSIEVVPVSHATFVLKWSGTTIYNDPIGGSQAFAGQPSPDIVLISDVHGDHLSAETISDVIADQTTIIAPQAVVDELPDELKTRVAVLANGESIEVGSFNITAIPMYNLPGAEEDRHVKGRGNGYVISWDGYDVYIAGDTADIPEMRALQGIDLAFVPMNLPYTMGIEDAADAVIEFKPATVYPYHYRGQEGLADVEEFKRLVNEGDPNINVVLGNWYPEN